MLAAGRGACPIWVCLGGKCFHPAPITNGAPPLCPVFHFSNPEPSPVSLRGACTRGGGDSCWQRAVVFTTPGYKGLGQESSFRRAQGERQAASCANSSSGRDGCSVPGRLPHLSHRGRLSPCPASWAAPPAAWERGLLTFPAQYPSLRKLLSSALGVLESVVLSLGWVRRHGNPLRIVAPPAPGLLACVLSEHHLLYG